MREFVVSLLIWVFITAFLSFLAYVKATTWNYALGFSMLFAFFMVVFGSTLVALVLDSPDKKHPRAR